MAERLQKILAQAGLGSRRACEDLIRAGRVTINGQIAELGTRANPGEAEILIDGKPLPETPQPIYILLHKPVGVLSSLRSQGGKPTVRNLVDLPHRLYPVGRLDAGSEGLILLTNDGDLTYQLTHPSYEHEKEYRVLLNRFPAAAELDRWRQGVRLSDGSKTHPAEVWVERPGSQEPWIRVILRQGMKRQIRRTVMELGLDTRRLVRIRFATLELGSLPSGQWRNLTRSELQRIRQRISKNRPKPGSGQG